jgi:hypothetical protein
MNPAPAPLHLCIAPAGSANHTARSEATPEALTVLAFEKSAGNTLASLNSDYWFTGQRMELVGGALETSSDWGQATFDGAGTITFAGTAQSASASGTTSMPIFGSDTYTVAPDGAITIGGADGAVSGDGELLFAVTSEPLSGEVGMLIAVRSGTAYDFNDLAGRYSLQAQGYTLGTGPGLPRTTTNFGEIEFAATGTTTGTWTVNGVTVDGTAQNLTLNALGGSGTATLSPNGMMTLTSPGGVIELGVSGDHRWFAGRAVGSNTNLMFGMRQCTEAAAYGTGTPGTGGAEPALGMKTFPVLGNANWRYAIAEGVGGGIGIVAIGFGALPGVPALGGTIWIDPGTVGYTALIVLSGPPGAAGAGYAETGVPIPANPGLAGVQLFAQALILDAAAPAGFAMSSGFRAGICR